MYISESIIESSGARLFAGSSVLDSTLLCRFNTATMITSTSCIDYSRCVEQGEPQRQPCIASHLAAGGIVAYDVWGIIGGTLPRT